MQRLEGESTEIAHAVELVEAEVWADWLEATPPATAELLGVRAFRTGGGAVAGMTRGTDVLLYNRVVGLGITEPARHAHIDELIARYGQAGVQRWMIQWSPSARPAATTELMRACGFYHHNNWMKLYRLAGGPAPEYRTDLRIELVGGERRDEFAALLTIAFDHPFALGEWSAALIDRPSWRTYMAFDGDAAVAAAAVFVHGRTAWLGLAATDPRHRGRGAQAALVATRIAAAQELGCDVMVAETAEDLPTRPCTSFRNLRRLGFEVAYRRPNYVMVAGTAGVGIIAEPRTAHHDFPSGPP